MALRERAIIDKQLALLCAIAIGSWSALRRILFTNATQVPGLPATGGFTSAWGAEIRRSDYVSTCLGGGVFPFHCIELSDWQKCKAKV